MDQLSLPVVGPMDLDLALQVEFLHSRLRWNEIPFSDVLLIALTASALPSTCIRSSGEVRSTYSGPLGPGRRWPSSGVVWVDRSPALISIPGGRAKVLPWRWYCVASLPKLSGGGGPSIWWWLSRRQCLRHHASRRGCGRACRYGSPSRACRYGRRGNHVPLRRVQNFAWRTP